MSSYAAVTVKPGIYAKPDSTVNVTCVGCDVGIVFVSLLVVLYLSPTGPLGP